MASTIGEITVTLEWRIPGPTLALTNCARCGNDHDHITFHLLNRPADYATHWGLCPVTLEPVLMYRGEKKNKSSVSQRQLDALERIAEIAQQLNPAVFEESK